MGMEALGAAGHLAPVRALLARYNTVHETCLVQNVLGRTYPNPVGLAAGFDKDAERLKDWGYLGFGFVEVGTVTPRPQPGNAKPRLFRMERERSIQNAMGFNNAGGEALLEHLKQFYPMAYPIGVNLGKNRDTPAEKALDEYLDLIRMLEGYCDYFVINLSSPNTPGLRDLENADYVHGLIREAAQSTLRPILLKVSPDRPSEETVAIASAAVEAGASGIIATNTTVDYSLSARAKDFGGISGALLREKSRQVLEALAEALFGRTVLVSVGGIDSPEEAWRRVRAGATLVQVYTGLIYEGPCLVGRMNRALAKYVRDAGLSSIGEAVGLDRRGTV